MSAKKEPMRRCIGCYKSHPKCNLIRISNQQGYPMIDLAGIVDGRGSYLCKNLDCLKMAKKRKSFLRIFKEDINEEQTKIIVNEIEKNTNHANDE